MPFDLETRTALIDNLRSACNLPDDWGTELDAETVTDDEVREAAREALLTRQAPRIRVTRDHGKMPPPKSTTGIEHASTLQAAKILSGIPGSPRQDALVLPPPRLPARALTGLAMES